MTLIELTIVLLVLVALAGLAVPYVADTGRAAACETTDASLAAVRDAIMGSGVAAGFYGDLGYLPSSVNDLFNNTNITPANLQTYNPVTRRGWHGPYVLNGTVADSGLISRLNGNFANTAYLNPLLIAGQSVILDNFHPPQCSGDCRSPVVLQVPTANTDASACAGLTVSGNNYARLVSAGPNGILESKLDDAGACGRGDDRVLFLQTPDPGSNQPCSN